MVPISLAVVQLLLLLATAALAAMRYEHFNVHQAISSNHHHHHRRHHRSSSIHHSNHRWAAELLHRDLVFSRNYSGYSHRLNDLLNRDAIRVAALTRRLSRSIPFSAASYREANFGSEVVSGVAVGSGEYFVRLGIGSPPRDQYVVVDSGSDIIWVQCQPCSQCYPQPEPVFDPSISATFSGVPCRSALCSLLDTSSSGGCTHSGRCSYEVSYGDGSYTKGTLVLETLTLGGATINNVAIGCGHRNHGLFVGAAGLLGLGGGAMSLVGQLGGQVGGVFSYCLVSRGRSNSGGSLVLGRAAAVPVGAVWVPLLRNSRAPSFYYVSMEGLGVGGVRVAIREELFQLSEDGEGGVVMDTGTAVTRLPTAAYEALTDAFAAATVELSRATGVSIFDLCYNLQGYASVRVPTVSFYFTGGTVLTLPASNFLIPVDEKGTFCFAFAASTNGLSIMGNIQQEGIQITFDSANGFVGFGPNTC